MLRILLLTLLLAPWLTAAAPGLTDPEEVGMSAERLERIGEWLDGIVERGEAAGFVTLVARQGAVVHHEARGTRGFSVKDPMPLNGIFDMASMTKPLTTVAALMLLEEGKITIDQPIGVHLPEFREMRVQAVTGPAQPAKGPIRVRHLFTHTSGVSDPRSRAETFGFPTLEAYMADVAKLPLAFEPGTQYLYGDSLDVLGYLVQVVSGQPLDEFIQERILDPLGMTDTQYWPPASKDRQRAILGVNGKDDLDSTSRRPVAAAEAATFIGGASGIYSTAADYWRFCQMLLNGGEFDGQRLLGRPTVEWITYDHLHGRPGFDRPGQTFGLGMAVMEDPGAAAWYYSAGSYYWGGSQGTVFWIDPAEDLIGVLMVQSVGGPRMDLREKFAALVYGAIVE